MVSQKQSPVQEWQVKVHDGSSVRLEPESSLVIRALQTLLRLLSMAKSDVLGFAKRIRRTGADDPRKVIHCMKVGFALALVSVFYYTRPLYNGVGGTSMWAVMTVVVVFEFTVGGSLYKGLNRATATLSAGILAVGAHWVASKSGETFEHIILGTAVFLLSSAATFSRFIPVLKRRFDYGIMIFILTFNFVAISGYRVDNLITLAQRRVSTISIGISFCLIVSILVCPVWAGEELHHLIARNMEKLAESLEDSVAEYFKDGETTDSPEAPSQKVQGYKCVFNSKASEDSLANLAKWEPSHGRFGFRHPWSQYLKVGAAMRYCAYCIEALNDCINSEIQAPGFIKNCLSDACTRLSLESSKVLKELASSIKLMKKSSNIEFLVGEMNYAVEEIHCALKTMPSAEKSSDQNPQRQPTLTSTKIQPLMGVLPLITVASLLMEISVRIEGIADTVEELADLACFLPNNNDEGNDIKPINDSPSMGPQEQV